jgi:hypothetical protein
MAQSSRAVVERLGPSCSHTRRLCLGPRFCNASGGLYGNLHHPPRASVSVDLYRPPLGAGHPFEPHASPAPSGTGVVESSATTICTGSLSPQALQALRRITGSELMKWTSRYLSLFDSACTNASGFPSLPRQDDAESIGHGLSRRESDCRPYRGPRSCSRLWWVS